jgi:hypothetical protein
MAQEAFRDTRTGLYRLIRKHVRGIDDPCEDGLRSFQSVDGSVLERQELSKDPAYAPENLLAYQGRQTNR